MDGFASRLQEALSEFQITRVVMGLPLDLRGSEGDSAQLARQLGSLIEQELGWPVEYMDERFSTQMADDGFRRSGTRRSKHRAEIDARAAAIILQDWLDYRYKGDS